MFIALYNAQVTSTVLQQL